MAPPIISGGVPGRRYARSTNLPSAWRLRLGSDDPAVSMPPASTVRARSWLDADAGYVSVIAVFV